MLESQILNKKNVFYFSFKNIVTRIQFISVKLLLPFILQLTKVL